MRIRLFALIVMLFSFSLSWPVLAQRKPIVVDLSEDQVEISTGFSGAFLSLYGVKTQKGQVAIVLRGPNKDVLVRQKNRFLGMWLNRHTHLYENVPRFYDYALSDAEENILTPELRKREGIGFAALAFPYEDEGESEAHKKAFDAALIRRKQADRLFPREPKDIIFLSDTFFKTEFYVPANVPTGQYVIETFLVDGEKIIDKRTVNVNVGQVGFSSSVYQFAHSYSFLYAVMIILIAVVAGWLSNAVRRTNK